MSENSKLLIFWPMVASAKEKSVSVRVCLWLMYKCNGCPGTPIGTFGKTK